MFGYTLVKKKELKEMADSAFALDAKNKRLQNELANIERCVKCFDSEQKRREADYAKKLEYWKTKYADELQKRLELAEKVKKIEDERHVP